VLRPKRFLLSADVATQGCAAYVEHCYSTRDDPQTRAATKCAHRLHTGWSAAVRRVRAARGQPDHIESMPCRLLAILFAVYAALMLFYSLTTFRALRTSPYHAFRTGNMIARIQVCCRRLYA
jgi:uncharacterized protein YceK